MFGSKAKREQRARAFEKQARAAYRTAQTASRRGDERGFRRAMSASANASEAARLTRLTGKPRARCWF